MRRFRFLAATAAAALLAACGLGGADYPEFSQASYRIEGMTAGINSAPATRTVIYRDGPQMRVEAVIPQYGPAVVVFDNSTNDAYVLTTAATIGTVDPDAARATPPATSSAEAPQRQQAAPQASATAPAGIAVKLDSADAPQPMETAWAALGEENARGGRACEVAGEAGREWTPRNPSAGVERVACITDDGIVLRLSESGAVLWEATALQRGAQDPGLFGVPANYQIVDPEAVAEQVGGAMENLDSVTGDGATPATGPRG